MPQQRPKPVVLAILDGFGIAPDSPGNAITRATTPNLKNWVRMYPAMTLIASGNEVGLQWGEMGNSEVGHLNIGAGRVYYQTYPRITQEIKSGAFFENTALNAAVDHVKKNGTTLHIIGIISLGNVHGSEEHVWALLQLAAQKKVKNVFVHAILDGRDVGQNTGAIFIKRLQDKMEEIGVGEIATLCGRFYAMDRDNNWDRVARAEQALFSCSGKECYRKKPSEVIDELHAQGILDEHLEPLVFFDDTGHGYAVSKNDAIIFFNFRLDRARQLSELIRKKKVTMNLCFATMTEYDKKFSDVLVLFPSAQPHSTLAKVISEAGLTQVHIAETEKYAHVTYFFNGGVEEPFRYEDRILIVLKLGQARLLA
jgi:2,3-bisphosphoglycerate-independent phosphoglycerate mutase